MILFFMAPLFVPPLCLLCVSTAPVLRHVEKTCGHCVACRDSDLWGTIVDVQGVHNMFEGTPDREWKDDEERLNKMVFIGKNLEMELLREGFEDCLHVEGEKSMIVPDEAVASA